jgi:hypothetical protein
MSMTQPPRTGAAEPINVVPRPRTVTGTRCLFASSNKMPTSFSFRGVMTASGRNDILLLSNEAAQQPCFEVSTEAPRRFFSCRVAGTWGLADM